MNIEVTKDEVKILDENNLPHENEYKITTCYFDFDEYTNSFQVKRAIFTVLSTGEMYETDIIDDECDVPLEILKKEYERVKLGVYGYNIGENEELLNRFSPSYDEFIVPTGSYEEGALSPEPITPSQYDIYSAKLQEGLNEVDDKLDEIVETVDNKLQEVDTNVSQKIDEMDQKIDETEDAIERAERLDVAVSKSDGVTTVTITKQDGSTDSENILDGEDGTDGENGIGLQYDWLGTSLGVKREDEALFTYVNLEGKKGDPGAINLLIVNELPLVGSEDTLYFVPKEDTEESDMYDEYVWINNDWELVGTKQITVDLSDYYTKTETNNLLNNKVDTSKTVGNYNSTIRNNGTNIVMSNTNTSDNSNVAGVIFSNGNFAFTKNNITLIETNNDGTLRLYNVKSPVNDEDGVNKKYVDDAVSNIDLDDYVKNTDYATSNVGGVIKINTNSYNTAMNQNGELYVANNNYATYQTKGNGAIIGKGTLENVITGKGLVSNTNYATASVGGVAKIGYSVTLDSNGTIMGVTREYNTYSSMNNNNFITKGTLENVITGKGLINRTYADARYVLEETIDDNVGYMYISPNIKDDKDVDFSINAQSNLDSEAFADMNFGVEYDENEGKGHGYFRLRLYDAGSIEIDNTGTKITNVITPTNDGDAVNKLYVDSLVGDIGTILDNINGEVIGG